MDEDSNGNGRDSSNGRTAVSGRTSVGTEKPRLHLVASRPEPKPKPQYDCSKCPGYCCSYKRISVSNGDLSRLAKHFGIERETAVRRFTKIAEGEPVLRHQKDEIYGTICMFFDTNERRCTIYEARPGVCREYPERPRCGYYEFLRWERRHQDDPEFVPLT